jgi:hypothetical protein
MERERGKRGTGALTRALGLGLAAAGVLSVGAAGIACGKKKGGEKSGKSGTAASDPTARCKEKNQIQIQVKEGERVKLDKPFELKKSLAFLTGQWINGKAVARRVSVAMANYEDLAMGRYMTTYPDKPGQVLIVLSMQGKAKEVPFEKQKEEYKKRPLPTGEFTAAPNWMDKHLHIAVFRGEKKGIGNSFVGRGKGKAVITHISRKAVCGTVDYESAKGSTVKASFALPIQGDLWDK